MKFRKSPHRTEKSLRHAQKPANPRSANPIGPESTSGYAWEGPPYGNPPQGPKNDVGEALSGHSRPLLRLAKVTQKRGFSRRFSNGLPTVFSASSTAVFRRLNSGFTSGFPAVLPTVFRRFDAGFPAVLPTVFQWFSSRSTAVLPTVSQRSPGGFPAVLPAGAAFPACN